MNHQIYGECPKHGRYPLIAGCCRPVPDTAFGPADHPDLPLGLRRHPRFALRLLMDGEEGTELVSLYVHTEVEATRLWTTLSAPSGIERERWDEAARAWVPF